MEKLYRQARIDKKVSLEKVTTILRQNFNVTLTKQALNLFEFGRLNLKVDVRKALAEYYGFPYNLEENIYYRKYREIDKDFLIDTIGKARSYVEEMNIFENNLGIIRTTNDELENKITSVRVGNIRDLESIVSKVRQKWQLGQIPINNVQNIIESNGIKIFSIDEYVEGFHGMTLRLVNTPTIIISTKSQLNDVKNDISIVRKRATVLHELAHIIVPFDYNLNLKSVETLCTSFSGMILMPYDIMKESLGGNRKTFSLKELLCLKAIWGISLQSLLYTAYYREIISEQLLKKTILLVKSHSIMHDSHILYEPDEVPESRNMYKSDYSKYRYSGIEKSLQYDWLKERYEMQNNTSKRFPKIGITTK